MLFYRAIKSCGLEAAFWQRQSLHCGEPTRRRVFIALPSISNAAIRPSVCLSVPCRQLKKRCIRSCSAVDYYETLIRNPESSPLVSIPVRPPKVAETGGGYVVSPPSGRNLVGQDDQTRDLTTAGDKTGRIVASISGSSSSRISGAMASRATSHQRCL